jgi:hypothetical protein
VTGPLALLRLDRERRPAHPEWCAGGHHCTASRRSDGEHASEPESFRTDVCKIVATRYQRADGSRDRVEVRAVVELDLVDEDRAVLQSRTAIAAVVEGLTRRRA